MTGSSSASTTRRSPTSSRALVVAAFVPVAFAVFLALIAPGFYAPLLDERMNVIGLPAVIPFGGVLVALLAIDLLVAAFVRSSFVQGLTLAVTTTAGVFLVILAPALARIAVALDGVVD
jgi:hypothetical protein